MRLVDETNAEAYLRETARIDADEPVVIRELAGGVSNMVLLVERPRRPAEEFVVKQARGQLRTAHAWFADVARIWREAEVLRICADLLAKRPQRAATPTILFEDRENYLFAMAAAPRPHAVWKAELLAGRVEARIAAACGTLLGTLHGESWLDEGIRAAIGDRTLFEQLRVDPYYRTLAEARPETREAVARVIESLDAHRLCLVQADFSPKNLLVFSGGMLMVDFETGHFGDPAFDLGFFLSHLVLKACHKIPDHAAYLELTEAFRRTYDEAMLSRIAAGELSQLWSRGVQNFALCAWSRLDAKSPVDYLSDSRRREQIRTLCHQTLDQQPTTWPEVTALATNLFDSA